MDFFDAVTKRKEVVKFDDKKVDDKLIGVLLYTATFAYSAGDQQEWNFIVVRNEKRKKMLSEAALNHKLIKEAPVVIVVCGDVKKMGLRFGTRGQLLYTVQDVAAACMLILAAANALGLGAVWVGSFDEERVRDILALPDHIRPLAIIGVGYVKEGRKLRERIPFDNLTWVERYGEKYDISYIFQPGGRGKKEVEIKPIGNLLEDFIKKLAKKWKK